LSWNLKKSKGTPNELNGKKTLGIKIRGGQSANGGVARGGMSFRKRNSD